MIIQNSPFYKPNHSVKIVDEVTKNIPLENKKETQELNEEGFSFWKWFKGLVNPLQNLPLISGIYSSVNAEDKNSDRDLVQNSLGGFLYGGPIGAIAGFGNWVFNKIFDKTPTELALDASGISDIWKDNNEKKENVIAKSEQPVIRGNEKRLYLQMTSSNDFLKNSKKDKLNLENNSNEKLANLDNSMDLKNEIKKDFILSKEKKIDPIIVSKKLVEPDLKNKFVKSSNEEAFREINFDYPAWKPENLEILGNKRDLKNSKLKYMDLEKNNSKESFYNIDA